jgi:L-ribulose-5-phosphate 4-epimerase
MMLEPLKERVYRANIELVKLGLVLFTWGNVSAADREKGLVVIKPSGVDYDAMRPDDMVVVDMDGKRVEGKLHPSSDLPTHIELYKTFPNIGGVAHTHSRFATAFAQAGRSLPAYGTTHADYFYGAAPCTRALREDEVKSAYEKNTGRVIAETFADKDADAIPGCLVKNHGPFSWGATCEKAVYHAAVLEYCAEMALYTERLNPQAAPADAYLLDKHYLRKHGKDAYYGQKENESHGKTVFYHGQPGPVRR